MKRLQPATLDSEAPPYPLALSMTQMAHFSRCKKLFWLDHVKGLTPKRDGGMELAGRGTAFHELMEFAAGHGGSLDGAPDDNEMLEIAQAYLEHEPLPSAESIISAERGYFAEIVPGFYVRASFDLVYREDPFVVVRDFKTFMRAPSIEPDFDFQSKVYAIVAERAFNAPVRFEWRHVRQELGRFLSGGKGKDAVWTPWEEDDLYPQVPDVVLTEEERHAFTQGLIALAEDILHRLDLTHNGARWDLKWYREPLTSGPHSCTSCFYKYLCLADLQHGGLGDDDIAMLTQPNDHVPSLITMRDDPRVKWHQQYEGRSEAEAIQLVYGTP